MIKNALKNAMMTSISEVLETMFFLTVEIYDSKDYAAFSTSGGEKILACMLKYDGPFHGHFSILVPQFLLHEITENFVGIPAHDLTADHINGTLNEIINMIAGSVFSTYDESLVFTLGIPEVMSDRSPEVISENSDDCYFFHVETMEGPFGIGIRFIE